MKLKNLEGKKIILASKSPRRQQLMSGLELQFTLRTMDVDESFPVHLKGENIALYLSKTKAEAFLPALDENEILITADTIVWIDDEVLNKASDFDEAFRMIKKLSARTHIVYTAVCITSKHKQVNFCDETKVTFAALTDEEITHYITHYQPYDKAGAYGAQDWIGLAGIEKLEGSYFTVMGLPVHRLYQELKKF
ncbi:MAG: Maf family nucleotide pyrophosphatase [Flavobacteriales bacterium]|nr:Maf family nucleotide pyrophosphatase [Flavobacteriales bacterium]